MRSIRSVLLFAMAFAGVSFIGRAQSASPVSASHATPTLSSRLSGPNGTEAPRSSEYEAVQARLAQGWNTWDVHSVTTHVRLPDGLAIHIGVKQNTTAWGDAFLSDALIGRRTPEAEEVFPGPHSWDGSYTDLRLSWKNHSMRIQSAHEGKEVVILATRLPSQPQPNLPPTLIFSVNYLWDRPGRSEKTPTAIEAHSTFGTVQVYCTCAANSQVHAESQRAQSISVPVEGPYFAADLSEPVGISTGKSRTIAEIQSIVERQRQAYEQTVQSARKSAPTADAIQTTLGWDTIYEPEKGRVVSPVSRVWSVAWGGYVIFDWDTFFAASLAAIGDRDLAYSDAIETLREETAAGFVPNYARAGGWKSSDRSEPPVGAITVLGLYRKFHDRWLLQDTFAPLLLWNRWWAEHRDIDGYMTWGSDGRNQPPNLDDHTGGTRQGAILESGLDNSPMYDDSTYNSKTHVLEYADVGLMSMYIADCDALADMAEALQKTAEAKELKDRSARYRAKLATLWSEDSGMFLNKDLHSGIFNMRLSPTNFYPLLARAASPQQADRMIKEHLLNPQEFWGKWILPSIARNDPAFKDQDYWRGRIWGPMNYLVYLGLRNYDQPKVTEEFAQKSFEVFQPEWSTEGHVHENYNALSGSGDDVANSDRFYHWGALLGLIEYMQQTQPVNANELVP